VTAGRFIAIGALLGGVGVAAGAFGAHALADSITAERVKVFETAARYHQIHAIAVVVVGLIAASRPSTRINVSGYLFLSGMLLFSGSLYILVLTDTAWLGAVTPLGGIALIGGWLTMAWEAIGYT
jgi:uncharacterized membrane protein YgdD (TMEM256/DUF423 family)